MTEETKKEILDISKEFAKGLGIPLNGSGWLILDPLSGYLNFLGYKNKLSQLPASEKHPQILFMTFEDGTDLMPAAADLKGVFKDAENWMWL